MTESKSVVEKLKQLNAERTQGEFSTWWYTTIEQIPIEQQRKNGQFIALAANSMSKLLDVIDCVRHIKDIEYHGEDCPAGDEENPELGNDCECGLTNIKEALNALEHP